jgi:hypothetical protein
MILRKIIITIIYLNLTVFSVLAQIPKNDCICPSFKMREPIEPVKAGESVTFEIEVKGDKGQTTYNWMVSQGSIIEGQGTPVIKVDTRGSESGQITATVQLGGWCPVCENMTASGSTEILPEIKPVLADKFTRANCEDVLARMDRFMTQLSNDPTAIGYFVASGNPKAVWIAGREAGNWVKIRNFDPTRIIIVNTGGRSERAEIELWLVAAGAALPEIVSTASAVETPALEKVNANPTEPYIFSSEYYDGVAGCGDDTKLDLEGFAKALKANPKNRGNLVILLTSKAEFRKKEKELLNYLVKKRIARTRLKTFYVNAFGGVELWLVPPKGKKMAGR